MSHWNKIKSRYARTMENLRKALVSLPNVYVYDNSDLLSPYRLVAELTGGILRTRRLDSQMAKTHVAAQLSCCSIYT